MASLEADKDQLHYDLKRLREMSQGEQLPDNLVSYTEFHIHLCAVHTYYSIQDLMKLFECGIHV